MRWKAAGNTDISLKGLHTLAHSQALTLGSWKSDSSSGGARDKQGKIEFCGFRMRAGRTATIVSLLSPPLVQSIGEHHLSYVEHSPNMAKYESVLAW